MVNFQERLRKSRIDSGYSQEGLASAVGLSKAAISSMERGNTKAPTPENLFNISKVLKVNPEWLAIGKGQNIRVNEDSFSGLESLDPVTKEILELLEGREYNELMTIKGWIHSIDTLRSTRRQRKESG